MILVAAVSLVGCSRPCFRQAGTSVQQCKRDLMLCIDQAQMQQKSQAVQQVRSCMQARGYEFVDAGKVAPGAKRITVIASFETYWVLDGLGAAAAKPAVTARQQPQPKPQPQPQAQPEPQAQAQLQAQVQPQAQSIPDAPQAKPIGYRARLDENGKYTLIPVYEGESTRSSNGGQ